MEGSCSCSPDTLLPPPATRLGENFLGEGEDAVGSRGLVEEAEEVDVGVEEVDGEGVGLSGSVRSGGRSWW